MTVDFGPVRTNGAFRLTWGDEAMTLTPLPAEGKFTVEIGVSKVLGRDIAAIKKVMALDDDGKTMGRTEFSYADGRLSFKADGKAFAYRVTW